MSLEERKNRCTLKLPIVNEDDDMMDFLDIDDEELVHDVKQAVSPTSSRSLENPDFNGINLLLSSTNTTNMGSAIGASTSSGQFIPYFGQPLLFPNNNQNLLNLVALCISTPPPFNGLPQNNPFFSSNGINEQVNFVPFSTAAPLFYFGLPDETLMGNSGNAHLTKYQSQHQLGKGVFSGPSNLNFPSNGNIQDIENVICSGSNNLIDSEIQYNSAKLRPNIVQNQSSVFPGCPNVFGEGSYGNNYSSNNIGLSKPTKLNPNNQLGLFKNLNFSGGAGIGLGIGIGSGTGSGMGIGFNYDIGIEKEYGISGSKLEINDLGKLSNQGQNNLYLELNQKQFQQTTNSNSKRQNVNLNSTSNFGEQPANSSSLNSGNSNEKKNRWQLSDPQFKSGYKGVSWNSRMEAWLAFFVENGVRKSKTFSSRKFGFNRAREKAIKYLDARRKGIILTTPPPLSPSKGIYDRIPQQKKMEPGQDNNYTHGLNNFPTFNNEIDNNNSNNNNNNTGSNIDITCNSNSNNDVSSSNAASIVSNNNNSLLETNQTVMCS
ncbi:erythrocyte membrane protein [Cryptosporidium ubiquitum]|uniref:Erythrocyte membrane protein n=1 Tax=Cryptosporidium ubiquitum TaxID=857276 RepID=A0A1J4MKN7_9CRYT|nr:erythrocyte membrane protein [Cryptosporidium ubiquitum]OII74793.1 erythrocyte membrane protein [Cryptosporidium ubiquitum]